MKKVLLSFLFIFMILFLAGCSNKKVVEEKIKGNCKAVDCITQIGVKDSLDEVNELIGFDGELKKEEDDYKKYEWKVSNSSKVTIDFYNSGKNDTRIDIKKDTVKNEELDFSKLDEMKELIKTGKMSYDKFVELVGGEGTLIQKSFYTKQYLWYVSSSKYFIATVSETTGMCTLLTGYNE
jgi:hypothetical protein